MLHLMNFMPKIAIMTRMAKNNLYDQLSGLITDFENPEEVENYYDIDWQLELYDMLVKIQKAWGELTGDDE